MTDAVAETPAGSGSNKQSRRWKRSAAGLLVIVGLVTGCPPAPYERDWVLKKGDYPVATLHGYGDNAEACREIVAFYAKEAGGETPLELRTDPTSSVGFTARPTQWVCSAKRTWLEVALGRYP